MNGGARPGAGRKKGGTNKVSKAFQEKIAATGSMPLDTMNRRRLFHDRLATSELSKGDCADMKIVEHHLLMAHEAAKDAAPYVHHRLQAVTHTGAGGGPIQTEDVSAREILADRLASLASRSAAG